MALLAWALAAPAQAGLEGDYSGQLNGQPVRASFTQQGDALSGQIDVGGYIYRVRARAEDMQAQGELEDQAGTAVPVELQLQGERLTVLVYAQGAYAEPLQLSLARGQSSQGTVPGAVPDAPVPSAELDPVLVGQWVQSDSYTSGDFSMATQTTVYLFPDGTYQYGDSRIAGGGDAGSFTSSDAGGGPGGRWRTANRILYILEPGSPQWVPYARYYVEGHKLLLTFGDGSRELWYRR